MSEGTATQLVLLIRDEALAARWREVIQAQGLKVSAPHDGAAGLAVVDAEGLSRLAPSAERPWVIGTATEPGALRALLDAGADDVCGGADPAAMALRLAVGLRTASVPLRGGSHPLGHLTGLMRAVSAAALRLRDREELLQTTCTLALAHGFQAASVLMLEPDRRTLRRMAGAGTVPPEEIARDLAARALSGARPTTSDLLDAATGGSADLMAFPLRRAHRAVGALVLRAEPQALAPPFRPLLEDLAAALSLALELIEQEAQRHAVVATLRLRERRQAVLAHLGERALETADPDALMAELVAAAADAVSSDFCRVLRLELSGQTLRPVAAHGLPLGGPEPRAGTPAGLALAQREPVLVERYADEPRFSGGALQRAGAVSGLHVVVPLPDGAWGALEIGRRALQRFTDDDVHFAQTCAALLGHALARGQAASALRRSKETFHNLIDGMPVAVAVVGADGRVLYVNERMVALVGHPREVLLAMPPAELLAPEQVAAARARQELTLRLRTPSAPESFRIRRADGSFALVESMALGLDFEGQPAVVAVLLDVSERQTLREKLMLAERLSAVGTLAAGVAHEINNPLAYVIGNLSFLAEELAALPALLAPGGEGQARAKSMAQAVEEAKEGAQRVRHIVGDLKTFSRIDEERRGPVDINALVDSSVNIAMGEIRHRARLVRTAGPTPPVHASPGRLGQLFLNLLVNAAQAIPEGRAGMEVRVVTRTDDQGRAVIEVFDTGVGIPPEVRPRIFDPFFTTKPVGVGTGLGLSICHGIVTRLGGELQVESEPGQGSCFRVVLPQGIGEAPAAQATVQRGPTRSGRILVIDDEPLVGAIVQRGLSPPHTVEREISAEAALARLQGGERFDLILCDLLMPGLTGMDLHAALRSTVPEQAARMLFLSGGAFTPRAQAFLEDPAHLCLEKPFDVDTLREAVRQQLERLAPG